MNWIWILALFTILILASIFRDKFRQSTAQSKDEQEHLLIQKYLLNDSPLYGYNRPKLWIHSKFEINSRQWKSFLSRNSLDLNQPYLFLTIQSIVNHCGNDFHICLIDDDSFDTLLPSWDYEPLSTLADPVKTELRHLAFLKIMYYYGGVVVPDSFLCCHSLLAWYQSTKQTPCIGERLNRTLTPSETNFIPSPYFMAAHKNNEVVLEWTQQVEKQLKESPHSVVSAISHQKTHPAIAQQFVEQYQISVFDGAYLGIKDNSGKPILVENLLTENYVDFSPQMVGIYIPADEILARTNWQWFAYMSQEEILSSHMIIAKYIMSAAVVSETVS